MAQIVQNGDSILRKKAEEVSQKEFNQKKLLDILFDMKVALNSQHDGVAIAASQIGISKRIFVVSKKVLPEKSNTEDKVFINPTITFRSKDKKKMEEGCLSVRWLYGTVKRSSRVTVEAQNELGEKFIETGTGLMAQIFQHEIDHLEGVLFVDSAENIREMTPANDKNKNTND